MHILSNDKILTEGREGEGGREGGGVREGGILNTGQSRAYIYTLRCLALY